MNENENSPVPKPTTPKPRQENENIPAPKPITLKPRQEKKPEVGHDLEIIGEPRVSSGRLLVLGRVSGHEFMAHIYSVSPPNPSWEIGKSGIVKLQIRRSADDRVIFDWDRGVNRQA